MSTSSDISAVDVIRPAFEQRRRLARVGRALERFAQPIAIVGMNQLEYRPSPPVLADVAGESTGGLVLEPDGAGGVGHDHRLAGAGDELFQQVVEFRVRVHPRS